MLANRVKETTATTGTGSFTTAGAVASFQTFNTAFGTDYFFKYRAADSTGNIWERGIGHLSDSTTLVRDEILENSSGGTSAINFANAPSLFVDVGPGDFVMLPKFTHVGVMKGANITSAADTTRAITASREYYVPFCVPAAKIKTVSVFVTSAAAASSVGRIAVYDMLTTGLPGVKLAETTTFAVDSTGLKTQSITLPEGINGWLWFLFISDGAPTVASPASNGFRSNTGTLDNETSYYFKGGSGALAPSPAKTGLSSGTTTTVLFGVERA